MFAALHEIRVKNSWLWRDLKITLSESTKCHQQDAIQVWYFLIDQFNFGISTWQQKTVNVLLIKDQSTLIGI